MVPATMTAKEVAAAFGVCDWTVYKSVREETFPIKPIRVGRRILWSRREVEHVLGVDLGSGDFDVDAGDDDVTGDVDVTG